MFKNIYVNKYHLLTNMKIINYSKIKNINKVKILLGV